MNEFEDYAEKFRAHLLVLNYAPRSIESYGYYLKQFFRYLRELGLSDLAALTSAHLRDYQSHLWEKANESGRPLSPNSQNSALRGVKVFFRVMKQEGYLAGDPARDIPFTKLQKRLPRSVLTRQEMKKLLDAPNVHTGTEFLNRGNSGEAYTGEGRHAAGHCVQLFAGHFIYRQFAEFVAPIGHGNSLFILGRDHSRQPWSRGNMATCNRPRSDLHHASNQATTKFKLGH